jgi:hypothetical protein
VVSGKKLSLVKPKPVLQKRNFGEGACERFAWANVSNNGKVRQNRADFKKDLLDV